MKTQCPFVYATFTADENILKVKTFDIRISCYEEECPAQQWEVKRCINPQAPEDQKRYLGGHCKFVVNICENCKDLHKCKKSGDNKDSCRQEEIDTMFRTPRTPQPLPKVEASPKPIVKTMGTASGHEIPLKDSLSNDIPIFPGKL